MPMMMMTAEKHAAAVESVAMEKPEPRADEDPETNWRRRSVIHRARWWRPVIVTSRRSAVRLNRFSAGVRAQNSSKRKCEHRQYQYKFFFHG
jgi:hypothetical protein